MNNQLEYVETLFPRTHPATDTCMVVSTNRSASGGHSTGTISAFAETLVLVFLPIVHLKSRVTKDFIAFAGLVFLAADSPKHATARWPTVIAQT